MLFSICYSLHVVVNMCVNYKLEFFLHHDEQQRRK